jgi:hypothetical protein
MGADSDRRSGSSRSAGCQALEVLLGKLRADLHEGFLKLAVCLICWRRLHRSFG